MTCHVICVIFLICLISIESAIGSEYSGGRKKYAAVTLVMGEYVFGALALGQSLVDVGSKVRYAP